MLRKTYPFIVVMLAVTLLTGCWSRRELNELAIALAIGIDKDEDGQYLVSAQVVDPSQIAAKKSESGRSSVILFQETGKTVVEAFRKMTLTASRNLYVAHIRLLVIGEDVAKEGIGPSLDLFSREEELRTDFFIVVAKDTTAANTLKVLTSLEKIPAVSMFRSLETSEKSWAPTSTVTLDELINNLTAKGKQAVLTGLEIFGDVAAGESQKNITKIKPSTQLHYAGLAVFRADKLVGWLNENESRGYNYVINNVKSTIRNVKCPNGGELATELIRSDTVVKAVFEDNKPVIHVETRSELNVAEVSCKIDLKVTNTVQELEKVLDERYEKLIHDTVKKVQKKLKSDIFGFGEKVRRANPDAWKKMEENWVELFPNLKVTVESSSHIRGIGTINNSYINSMKE
jgi:spore germination protein KC